MDSTTSRTSTLVGVISVAVLSALLAIFALGVALSSRNGTGASGDTDTATASVAAAAAPVTVSLTEFAIGDVTVDPGGSLRVVNDGAAPHNLKIEGTDLGTADLQPGETADLDLAVLEPGAYTIFCAIPGHQQAGMSATLTVGDAGAEAPSHGTDHVMATAEDVAAMEQAMQDSLSAFPAETAGTGGQVMEPEILPDGTKYFKLTVDEVMWEVAPGQVVNAMAYNGQIPGPTIKVDVGDHVQIDVENELDFQGTSLHPHGLNNHANAIDGVSFITQDPIAPGDHFVYDFVADTPSVAMYHSHHMSLTQVPNGLAGALIVGDYGQLTGHPDVSREITMMLNDAGNIGFTLNGKSFPATEPYTVTEGDRLLVHYMNEGLMAHPMHLHGQNALVVAKDGFVLDSPYYADTINIAPGERYTVLIEADNVGTWVWHCHILSHVKKPDGSMFGMLTAMIVEPKAAA